MGVTSSTAVAPDKCTFAVFAFGACVLALTVGCGSSVSNHGVGSCGTCQTSAAVAAGDAYTCALTTAGGVLCWGHNAGELVNNSTTDSTVPVAVSGLSSGIAAISTGDSHTCALTPAGGVLCWGDNFYGQLGNSSTTNSGACVLSCSPVPVAVSGLSSGVAAISAGGVHTCALTTAGGVLCWGDNFDGQLGNNSMTNSPVPVAVSGLSSGVAAISAGGGDSVDGDTCALTTAGGVLCWGANSLGQLGNNSTTGSPVPVAVSGLSSGVAAISTGELHACALTMAGGVLCWGANFAGQLGNSSTTTNCVLNGGNAGPCSLVPVAVSGLSSGVAAISAGALHTCALTTAGGVLCWGDNDFGSLGNDSTATSAVPVRVWGLYSGINAISAGEGNHTCALTTTGEVLCWGLNGNGQLGSNTSTPYGLPAPASLVPKAVVWH